MVHASTRRTTREHRIRGAQPVLVKRSQETRLEDPVRARQGVGARQVFPVEHFPGGGLPRQKLRATDTPSARSGPNRPRTLTSFRVFPVPPVRSSSSATPWRALAIRRCPAVAVVPAGWADANANLLTDDGALDAISGLPSFRGGVCRSEKTKKTRAPPSAPVSSLTIGVPICDAAVRGAPADARAALPWHPREHLGDPSFPPCALCETLSAPHVLRLATCARPWRPP